MKKRICSMILCICMLLTSLAGCSNGEKGTEQETKAGGKGGAFREEALSIPFQTGDRVVSLLRNGEGALELYGHGEKGVSGFTSQDGKNWENIDTGWITLKEGETLNQVIWGADGKRYAAVQFGERYFLKILKEEADEILLPAMDKLAEAGKFYSYGSGLQIMADGTIVLQDFFKIYVLDGASGEIRHELVQPESGTSGRRPMDVSGTEVFTAKEDASGFLSFDIGEGKEKSSYPYKETTTMGRISAGEDGSLYVVNEKGISRLQPNGELAEVLLEGNNCMLSSPLHMIEDVVFAGDKEYFIMYNSANSGGNMETSLYRYYFDETVSAIPEKRLTVYGLTESLTVRQAISEFRKSHPEVAVDYQTGMGAVSGTKADSIRSLNTELLNKNGADVLLLDGLPVKSFMEKGVLADLREILDVYLKDGSLSENMTAPYAKDKEIYAVPIHYGIPMVFGDDEMIALWQDMDKLQEWLQANKKELLFKFGSVQNFLTTLLYMNYDKLFDEQGMMQEDVLTGYMELAKEVMSREGVENIEYNSSDSTQGQEGIFAPWSNGMVYHVTKGESKAAVAEIKSTFEMMEPYGGIREGKLKGDVIQDYYMPHGIVGMNNNAKEPELAAEFIRTLLSEEVQSQEFGEGLPVNAKANEKFLAALPETVEEAQNGGMSMAASSGEDGEEGDMRSYHMPLRSEVEELLKRGSQLKKAALVDEAVLEMILNEAKLYEDGSETAQEAAAKIMQKVQTYLAE